MDMQTIAKNLADNRAAISKAILNGAKDKGMTVGRTIAKGVMNNRAVAAVGLGTLLISGAALAGYLLVRRMRRNEGQTEPAPTRKKSRAERRQSANSKNVAIKNTKPERKAGQRGKKMSTETHPRNGHDQNFIPTPDKAAKSGNHSDEHHRNAEKAAMRQENQKVKAIAGNQKRKLLRIPGK